MRVLKEYINVVVQFMIPYLMALLHTWLKHQRTLLATIKDNVVTAVLATVTSRFSVRFVSAGELLCGTSKLDPIFRTFRVINFRPRKLLWNPPDQEHNNNCGQTQSSTHTQHVEHEIEEPEKSVHCEILHDPGPGLVTADIIFIHGLKGSLDRTWTQGVWDLKDCDNTSSRVLLRKSCSTSSIRQQSITNVRINNNNNNNIVNQNNNKTYTSRRLGSENGLVLSTTKSISQDNITEDVDRNIVIENNNSISDIDNSDRVVFTCGDEASDDGNSITNESPLKKISTNENKSRNFTNTKIDNDDYGDDDDNNNNNNNNSKKDVSRCWPKDWLPMDCPGVRVIALNYTTDPYLWRPVWISKRSRTSMCERGWEMIEHLVKLGVGRHPIVWVGHSKGGLFVKQMLVHGCESNIESHMNISRNTKGILFYSVPHRGSPLANLNLPLLRQSIELTEVRKDSAEVLELHKKFCSLLDQNLLQIEVRSFIETTLTLMSLFYVRIVSVESADAEIGDFYGVPTDHRNICKPRSRDCFLYQELVDLINSVCEKLKT